MQVLPVWQEPDASWKQKRKYFPGDLLPHFLRELKEEEYSVKSWLDQATAEKKKSGYSLGVCRGRRRTGSTLEFFRHLLHRTGRGSAPFPCPSGGNRSL